MFGVTNDFMDLDKDLGLFEPFGNPKGFIKKDAAETTYRTKSSESFMGLQFLNKYLKSYRCFIAGGCFKNIFTSQKFKDIDMFFFDEAAFNEVDLLIKADSDYTLRYENDKVIAYNHKDNDVVLELIRSTFGFYEEVMNRFDWTITKFAYYKIANGETDQYQTVYHKDFFEHLLQHRLVADNILPYPVSSFERALRYKGYGYSMCRETKVKLIQAIKDSQLDEDLSASLYDGVD